jgi:hypothetical protein
MSGIVAASAHQSLVVTTARQRRGRSPQGESKMEMPVDLYQVYAEFGMAAEKAQLVEMEAGNVALTFVAVFMDRERITPEVRAFFKALVEDVNRQTFGALLRVVKGFGTFDPLILEAIDEALELRNHLTHRFFRSHNFAILTEEGRRPMIAELLSIKEKLDRAHSILLGVCSSFAALHGFPSLPDEVARDLIENGKRVAL